MKRYSISEAAELLSMRPRQVRRAIREGDLEAEVDGRDFLIEREELEEFAEERGIELDAEDLGDDDLDDRLESAMEEHRPSWEAGFRSGFAAGAQEDDDD